MPALLSLINVTALSLAAATFGEVMKTIGIIVLVIVVGVILNAVGLLKPLLALAVGLYQLYIYGVLAVVVIYLVYTFIYKLFGLYWTIGIAVGLLLLIGLIVRIRAVRKQRKQIAARAAINANPELYQTMLKTALKNGYCLKCYKNNTNVNKYAGTLTCNDCGAVFNLPD